MTNEDFIKNKKAIIKDNDILIKNLEDEYVSIFETYFINKKSLTSKQDMFDKAVELLKINQNIFRLSSSKNKEK